MSTLIPVEFHGDILWAQRHDGEVYAAVRPICEALGLTWGSQYNRIQRDTILSEGVFIMKTPSHGGPQETVCLPLRLMNGWLFGIDENRIKKPDIRARVIAYKRECYDVLHRHFQPKAQPAKPAEAKKSDQELAHLREKVGHLEHIINLQTQLFQDTSDRRDAYITAAIVRILVRHSDLDDATIAEAAKSEIPYVAYIRQATDKLIFQPV